MPCKTPEEGIVTLGETPQNKTPLFGAFRDRVKFIASDFDEPLQDFAEYITDDERD